MTALFWSSVALLVAGLWLRHRAWVEPLPGEQYLLDGRLVTVTGRSMDPNIFAARPLVMVTAPWMDGQSVPVTANYWRRARPAASDPPRLLDEARRKGAS